MTTRGVLAPLIRRPERAGIFSDFDGTLSPIVADPAAARPVDGAADALAALARRYARVAVVSGRPAAFLLHHLGDTGVALWGLHGLETVVGGRVVPAAPTEEWLAVVGATVRRAGAELGPDVEVEPKGPSLTLHFRRVPDRQAEVREWGEAAAATTGLVVHPARMSYELRPPIPHGKGLVIEQEAAGLEAACFAGDDLGDLEACEALDRLAAAGAATVRVAVASSEAPPGLIDRADLTVTGPEGVLELLRVLDPGPAHP